MSISAECHGIQFGFQIGGNICLSGGTIDFFSLFILVLCITARIMERRIGLWKCQSASADVKMKFVGIFVSNHSGSRPSQHIR